MRYRDGLSCGRTVALPALLVLAACTTNTVGLAPADPSVPWRIERPPFMQGAAPPSADEMPPALAPTAPPPAGLGSAPAGAAPAAPNAEPAPPASGSGVSIDPTRGYGLAELIDIAQRSSPETRVAWERARKAALSVGLVESAYLPQISADALAGYQHTTLPIPANLVPNALITADTVEFLPTLAIKWLLFDFGRRAGAEAAARAESFVTNVAFTGAHQKLIFAVSRDYFALGAARGRLRVAEEALNNAEIVEDAVLARRRNGLATTVDVAQAQRQTATARFNLTRATGDEHSAYHALIASMGVPPGTVIAVSDDTSQPLPAAPAEAVDKFVEQALANRPDVIAAGGSVRAAEAKLDQARADYNPTIALSAQGYQNIGALSVNGSRYFSVNEPSGNILFKFSWPLFDGGARDARVGIARSDVSAARDELDKTRVAAVKQVTDAYDALKTGLAAHASAVAVRRAARIAYDSALDAYRHGLGTYTDLVNDETALTRSQSDLEDASASVFTAASGLAFATGSIASDNAR
jgi:outer membrane protein